MTYTPFFSKTSFDENITNQKNPYTAKAREKKNSLHKNNRILSRDPAPKHRNFHINLQKYSPNCDNTYGLPVIRIKNKML